MDIANFNPNMFDAMLQTESSGNPAAVNKVTGATGLGQIMEGALSDFNNYNKENYTMEDMKDAQKNQRVSYWYLYQRIPQMLKHYKIPVTEENALGAYNWGIGNIKNQGVDNAPQETKDYIQKIKSLLEKSNK